jgi:hypothetical protein
VNPHSLVDAALVDAALVDAAVVPAQLEAVRAGIDAVARLASWCDAQKVRLLQLLEGLASSPDHEFAAASNSTLRQVERLQRRAAAVEQAPAFGAGTVSAEHVDVMARGLKDAPQLAHRADRLLVIAQHSNPDEFAKTVAREVRQIRRDDGEQRFLRQRAATRLRTWIDRDTGMFCLAGRFDPLTGAALDRRIRATVEQLFHDRPPELCPSDPLDKQEFLGAHALKALINGKAGRGAGAAEVIAVVDAREPGPYVVDWGLPIEVPDRVLRDLLDHPDTIVTPVVVRNGVVLHAPGRLSLGRSTRLANRAQRRALRGLHPTCAVPGCAVRSDACTIHHIIWWRNGGLTDLENLIPLCSRHHHAVHDGGWSLRLGGDRSLTVTLPDGTVLATGPPTRSGP